jgi:hypothetical protein
MKTLSISCPEIHERYKAFPDAEHYRRFCTTDWLASWVEFYCARHLKGHAIEIRTPRLHVISRVTRVTVFDVLIMRPTIRLSFTPHTPGTTSHIDISMLHCRPIFLRDGEIMLSMWNHGLATLRPHKTAPMTSSSEM